MQLNNLHCMIDLETMGTSQSPAICSIGAVIVDGDTGNIHDTFYVVVSLESSVKAGLKIDASTVRWWLSQTKEAQAIFAADTNEIDIAQALRALSVFVTHWRLTCEAQNASLSIWSNGVAEDLVWLTSAYNACELNIPWNFRRQRCYRTLKELLPHIKGEPGDVAHHALADAEWQAKHLVKLLKEIPHAT